MPSPYNRFNKRSGSYNDHRNGGRQGGTYRENHYGQQTEYVGMKEIREAYLDKQRKKTKKKEKKEERKRRKKDNARLVATVKKAMKRNSSDSESESSSSDTSDSASSNSSDTSVEDRKKSRKRKRKEKKKKTKQKQKKQKTNKKEVEEMKKNHEETLKTMIATLEEEKKKREKAEADIQKLEKKTKKEAAAILRKQLQRQIHNGGPNPQQQRLDRRHRPRDRNSGEAHGQRPPERHAEGQPRRRHLQQLEEDGYVSEEDLLDDASVSEVEDGELRLVMPVNPAVALDELVFKANFNVEDDDSINEDILWFKNNDAGRWRTMMTTIKSDFRLKAKCTEECDRLGIHYKTRDTRYLLYARLTAHCLRKAYDDEDHDEDHDGHGGFGD